MTDREYETELRRQAIIERATIETERAVADEARHRACRDHKPDCRTCRFCDMYDGSTVRCSYYNADVLLVAGCRHYYAEGNDNV
jgi:hypothetical protein